MSDTITQIKPPESKTFNGTLPNFSITELKISFKLSFLCVLEKAMYETHAHTVTTTTNNCYMVIMGINV